MLYDDVRQKGIDFARVRLVKYPLTPYLKFEFMSYRVRRQMGETIRIVELPGEIEIPSDEYFDFLLFDSKVALVHDYGDDGLQCGGWYVDTSSVITKLNEKIENLRKKSVDLASVYSGD